MNVPHLLNKGDRTMSSKSAKSSKPSKTKSGKNRKLTTAQVITRIMDMVQALSGPLKGEVSPGASAAGTFDVTAALPELPEYLTSRKHWQKSFAPSNKRAAQVLEVLSELPAFTNHAPKSNTPAAWAKVFEKHMGLEQVPGMLREIHAIANQKPAERRRVVRWRDRFGVNELVQRVRPAESFDYIHNPHRGTTTFQRFQGEDTYPSFVTSDTHGPVTFPPPGKVRDNVKYMPKTTLDLLPLAVELAGAGKGQVQLGADRQDARRRPAMRADCATPLSALHHAPRHR